mmetsp:Transcript_3666/g.8531  ORF Transcript_3666/g.8531 Transcript_3666/m.8531 type:complete len:1275 (-) Transcript_3666:341-4165(-)
MATDAAVVQAVPVENQAEETPPAKDDAKDAKAAKPVVKSSSMRQMLSVATAPELLLLVGGCIGAVIVGLVNPAMIYVFGRMIDSIGQPDMNDQVVKMLLVGTAGLIGATLQGLCLRSFSVLQSARLRKKYFEVVIGKDIAWFDVRTPAGIPAELNEGAERVGNAWGDKFGGAVQGVAGALGSIALAFYMGWNMALVILCAVPLMAAGMTVMGQAVQEVANETQSWYAKAAAQVEECLYALRTVVAFGGERKEIAHYEEAVVRARKGAVRNYYKTSFGLGYIEFIWALSNTVALFYGMTLIYDGKVNESTGEIWTGGDVLIVFFSVVTGGFMLGQLEPGMKAMGQGRVALANFFDALNEVTPIEGGDQSGRPTLTEITSFELQNVHFFYPARPETQILKGLSLKIEKGQKVAFVGESGSGKSTVMSLLERFYDPTQGTVLVNGQDIRSFAPTAVRNLIGYVGQEPVLFATTIRQNILYGWPSATEDDIKKVVDLAEMAFAKALPKGLDTFVGSGGSQFSGGQKQRVAIARAMLRKPQVLFLDEATSALDNVSEKKIQETLEHIGQTMEGSLTSVAIAHRLTTIKKCDKIFALKDGVVAESGSHDELMAMKGIYFALAAAQQQGEAGSGKAEVVDIDQAPQLNVERQMSREHSDKSKHSSHPADPAAAKEVEKEAGEIEVPKSFKVPYRRLAEFCRPEWGFVIPGVIGSALHGANNPVQAFLLVNILNSFYLPKEEMWDEVVELCIQFAVVGVIVFLGTAVHTLCFGVVSEGITQRLRVTILTAIFRQELGFHDDPAHTPALLGVSLSLWAYRVRTFCASVEVTANTVASITLGIAIAFIGCWQMTLAMMAAIPVLIVATSIQFMMMTGGTNLGNDKIKTAQQVVSDSVQNARTVHATGMEKVIIEYHNKLVDLSNSGFAIKCFIGGLAYGVSMSAPQFVMTFGFWYSDWLVKNGSADFKGSMLAFMGIMYAAMGVGQATTMMGDATKARQACYSIFQLLDRVSLVDGLDPKGQKPPFALEASKKSEAGNIEFTDVKFAYPFRPDTMVLKGITFKVQAGQSVGLVGPSGGGKSTIMALLQRFYDPASGSVTIGSDRMPLDKIDIRWWRRQVGFVGQEPILFNTTVKRNILYGLDQEAGETVSEQRLLELKKMCHLEFLDKEANQGWETEVGPRGSRLSGGQKQRVAICRALIRDPPVLLLDEATSALDTESERVVQQALEEARQGRTSFSIAHRLSTIQDCDIIIVTAEGRVVESGTHSELLSRNGVYKKLQATSK